MRILASLSITPYIVHNEHMDFYVFDVLQSTTRLSFSSSGQQTNLQVGACPRDTAPVSLTPSKGHLPSFLPHLEPAIPPRSLGSFNTEKGLRKHKVDATRADCFQYFSVKKARKYILSGRKITNHEWILVVPTETSNQGFLNVFASIFVSVLRCKSCFLTAQTRLLVFFILNAKYVTCT